jgi:sugar phosphate isomerase/epimerase
MLRASFDEVDMKIGISTSCFYPMCTEKTLARIALLGFKQIEVFVNAPSESTVSYAKKLRKMAETEGLEIIAFHPFSSFAETYCLFGVYEQRRQDFYDIYKGYFEAAAAMGAMTFNFHGCHSDWTIEAERYCEIYHELFISATQLGVRFSQENVNRHYSANVDFINTMKQNLKDELWFTFDVKQAMRSGEDPSAVRDAMGDRLIHFHASDYHSDGSCALPGTGECHYAEILNAHIRSNKVSKVIEVYSGDYTQETELRAAADFINEL